MVVPDPAMPGQESVWDYPRPAVAERCDHHLKIVHRGVVLAQTRRGIRTLETSHPPSYYFPRDDIAMDHLAASSRSSVCEWKGRATYFHVAIGGDMFADVGWSYPAPKDDFHLLQHHVAFYAGPFEDCFVDGEKVVAQPGSFYGGWITSLVAGPFKGTPGSMFW